MPMSNQADPSPPGQSRPSSGLAAAGSRVKARDEDAFVHAVRHSRRVRALKVALPVLGGLLAFGFAGYSYILTPPKISVDVTGTAIRDGKLVMSNPKLDGFTRDNRPYSMTAMRAVQDIGEPDVIGLEQIAATFPISQTGSATVDAPAGVYDQSSDTLDITGEMTVTTSDGMVARFKSAFLDVGTGRLTSSEPVDIRTGGSHVTAESMALSEGGKLIVFENSVRVRIERGQLKTAQRGSEAIDVHN